MMIEDYDGTDVADAAGERIGSVERSYADDQGTVRFIEVKLRGLRAKHRLIPMDIIDRMDDALTVPFAKGVVEESPDASSARDTLEEDTLNQIRAYYESQRQGLSPAVAEAAAIPVSESKTDTTSSTSAGQEKEGIGDTMRGAVEQVREKLPGGSGGEGGQSQAQGDESRQGQDRLRVRDLGDVIEVPIVEEEIVKRPVVKEVLRIRKSSTSERQTVQDDVRKEDVEVISEGDVPVRGNSEDLKPE